MLAFTDRPPAGSLGVFGLPSHWEIVIVVVLILLLFGGKKIPELARGLGRGLRNFRDELRGVKSDIEEVVEEEEDDHGEDSARSPKDRPQQQDQTQQKQDDQS